MTDLKHPQQKTQPHRKWYIAMFLSGILLPAIALAVEMTTHICAEVFFDPLPTIWHAIVFGAVPVSNFLVWLAIRNNKLNNLKILGLFNGFVIGVTFFYSLVFLPLIPVSIVAIIFFGLGFLSISPLLSFISAIMSRRQMQKMVPVGGKLKFAGLWGGISIAICLLITIELPSTMTRVGLMMATADSADRRANGIKLLRMFGDDEIMLRMCYRQSRAATDLIGFIFTLSQESVMSSEVRKVYYQVTGIPFNKKPTPVLSHLGRYGDYTFDGGLGGARVADRVHNLFLSASRQDGSLDPEAGLGYLEWTLVFENRSKIQREARAQILLPPGGVVSRLTLWIDDEPREAAFAARKKVKQAYNKVVRQRRDPVLVTTSGPDRVLVQCFPVPIGGEMKIRLGITAPLVLETRDEGVLLPPRFLEHNFSIPEDVKHSIWIESNSILTATKPILSLEPSAKGYALRGRISNLDLSEIGMAIRTQRNRVVVDAWTHDPLNKEKYIISQKVEQPTRTSPERVIFVIDGSQGMSTEISAVADAISTLPESVMFRLIIASDDVEDLTGSFMSGSTHNFKQAGNFLKEFDFKGGRDNVPALLRAMELCSNNAGCRIIWVHGQQPVILQSTEMLRQQWERRPDHPSIIDFQISNGPNRIMEKLSDLGIFSPWPIINDMEKDLTRLFLSWKSNTSTFVLIRKKIPTSEISKVNNDKKTSAHLARLWANEEISKLLASGAEKSLQQALILAEGYQLVTPISGAVVLETKQQYDQAGLEPVDEATVPTIPEPQTIFLMVIVGMIFLLHGLRASKIRLFFKVKRP